MIKTSGARRLLAGVVSLALAGSLTALAGAGSAVAADARSSGSPLLSAGDFTRAGWPGTSTYDAVEADELLAQCFVPLPYWSTGFRTLQRRSYARDSRPVFGTELTMRFRTSGDAKAYVDAYVYGVDSGCVYTYGSTRWDVRARETPHLAHGAQHARTWTVADTTGGPQRLSITVVRERDRVALLWLSAEKGAEPTDALDLHRLVQRAADRLGD